MMEAMSMPSQLPAGAATTRRTNRELLGKFLTGAIVIAVLVFLVVAVSSTETKVDSVYPKHLESVTPANASQNVPSQSSIVADLEFGYTGALIINGHEIPKDQVDEVVATGELRFTPADGKEFRRLPGGGVTATVVFWPSQGERETDAVSYSWILNVN
jgi:hypothetical protein